MGFLIIVLVGTFWQKHARYARLWILWWMGFSVVVGFRAKKVDIDNKIPPSTPATTQFNRWPPPPWLVRSFDKAAQHCYPSITAT